MWTKEVQWGDFWHNGNSIRRGLLPILDFSESATTSIHALLHLANNNSKQEAIDNNYVFCLLLGYEFIMMQKLSCSDAMLTMINTTKTKKETKLKHLDSAGEIIKQINKRTTKALQGWKTGSSTLAGHLRTHSKGPHFCRYITMCFTVIHSCTLLNLYSQILVVNVHCIVTHFNRHSENAHAVSPK